jgi:NAD(P)-dependent dehydrogenase (short-subunit alcohol dehydrogenase family)
MAESPRAGGDWTTDRIGDQRGRVAVVTGANTGVGFEVAKVLAARGATVILACRDTARGKDAVRRLKADSAGSAVSASAAGSSAPAGSAIAGSADVRFQQLDLASLRSVREAADRISADHPRLDLLINNAGVMWAPRGLTEDGFERHLGINHLGHFALTGLLLPALVATPGSRVVVLSSPAHRRAAIDFDDLQSEKGYRAPRAYGQSKLANLMFAYELDRRLRSADLPTAALAAHPGGARSELNRNMPWMFRGRNWGLARPITHSVQRGALPILRAATDPQAHGGQYYGPDGRFEFTGGPTLIESTPLSHDVALQRRLWDASEQLTQVSYEFSGLIR